MRAFLTFPISLLCAIIALDLTTPIQCEQAADTSYPSRFIVSLHPNITPSLKDFENHLKELQISYKIIADYTTLVPDVFYGVSLYLEHSEDISVLDSSPRVERLNVVKDVFPLKTFSHRMLDRALQSTPENYPPHVQTNVTDLHRLGILGQGVKVAIIDSGVDCAHPALGGGFGHGRRIAFGLDLVGDKFNGTNDPIRSGTPCTKCSTHGTHVTGIVAAQNAGYGFTGVAPKATIGMYRIFGCGQESQTRDDIVLEAVLTAQRDGADIITMSLGGTAGWGEGTILSDVINTLVLKKSAIIIASAGNDGGEGMFLASNPASAKNAISVGSVDATSVISHSFQTSTGRKVYYRSAIPLVNGSFPVYFTSNSNLTLNDACEPLPPSTPDLSKHIVIIRRGTCFFTSKIEHAQAKGAKFILFYWNSTTLVSLPDRLSNSSVGVITAEDGEKLFKESRKNRGIRLNFLHSWGTYVPSENGGYMSSFSQFGPSYDFSSPQPAFSAVGGDVVSTYPLQEGGYASSSGTSMAAPQIAGITALILSARGKIFDGLSIRSRLSSTSRLVRTDRGKGLLESVVHQGGGLVNAYCAVFSNTSVSVSSLALNDSNHMESRQEFIVANGGIQPVSYILEHLPAGSISAFSGKSKYNRMDSSISTASANYATLTVYPESFTLRPGEQQTIRINVSPPTGLNPEDLTVYSGYVSLAGDIPCESHTVPYYGVFGSMKAQKIIDRGPHGDVDQDKSSTYNFPHFVFSNNNRSSRVARPLVWDLKKHNYTTLRFRANFGSPYMRLDLVPRNALFSNITNITNPDWKSTFGGVKLLGLIPLSEADFFARSSATEVGQIVWNATVLTNEHSKPKLIADGTYRVLLRALKVNGEKQNDADFETWLSPLIYLRR